MRQCCLRLAGHVMRHEEPTKSPMLKAQGTLEKTEPSSHIPLRHQRERIQHLSGVELVNAMSNQTRLGGIIVRVHFESGMSVVQIPGGSFQRRFFKKGTCCFLA